MNKDGGSGPLWRVLGTLERVRKQGKGWEASCPVSARHKQGDKDPSLSVGMGYDGRVLLNCHAGCTVEDVTSAIGLSVADLFEKSAAGNVVRRFRLLDSAGSVVAIHAREELPDKDKKLWWESHGKTGLNGTTVESLPLYRLPELLSDTSGRPVYLVEGEKAADALAELGLLVVATVTGAGTVPSKEALEPLQGREVRLWADNDATGQEHMDKIAKSIKPTPFHVFWPEAPPKGDAADFVEWGGTAEDVEALVVHHTSETSTPSQVVPVELEPVEPHVGLVDLVAFSAIEPEEVQWLWQGRIALGKLTVLMGDPGLGKSLLTVHCAAVVSTGGTWPDGEQCTSRSGVIILTAEDGPADTVRPRLDAAAADVDRVFLLRSIRDSETDELGHMFRLATDIGALEEAVQQTKAKLVILDPLNAYLGGVDSHKAAEVRGVLAPLAAMADRTGVALLVLHHLNKGTSANALYRAGGSLDFVAAARSVLGVVPDPDQPERRLLLSVKINIAIRPGGLGYRIQGSNPLRASSAPIIAWDQDPVAVDPLTAFAESSTPEERWQRHEVKDVLLELLKDGEAPAKVVDDGVRAAGVHASEKLVRSVSRELGVRVIRRGFGPGGQWVWSLPPKIPPENSMPSLPDMTAYES